MKPEDNTPEAEHQHHRYIGNAIPWWVRVMWVGFWLLAIIYVLRWLFPAIKSELLSRP
jgi:hypothetical protein